MSAYIATVPEVTHYQAYAGTAAPINFNGLVRQYYMRTGRALGDIQVNLVDKHHRDDKSHVIAMRVRPALEKIAAAHQARVKVVGAADTVPADRAQFMADAAVDRWRTASAKSSPRPTTSSIKDDSTVIDARKSMLVVDRKKAALLGILQQAIVSTLYAGMAGEDVTHLHDGTASGRHAPGPAGLRAGQP